MASGGGSITATDVTRRRDVRANSATIATDRGGGTITVEGGTYTTTGKDLPVLYHRKLTATGITGRATGSECRRHRGANSVTPTDSTPRAPRSGRADHQSMSGDASGSDGVEP